MASGRFMEEMMREHEQSLLEATCGGLFDHIDDLLDFPKEDCAADVLLLDAPAPGSPLAARVLGDIGCAAAAPVKEQQPAFMALPPPLPARDDAAAFMTALGDGHIGSCDELDMDTAQLEWLSGLFDDTSIPHEPAFVGSTACAQSIRTSALGANAGVVLPDKMEDALFRSSSPTSVLEDGGFNAAGANNKNSNSGGSSASSSSSSASSSSESFSGSARPWSVPVSPRPEPPVLVIPARARSKRSRASAFPTAIRATAPAPEATILVPTPMYSCNTSSYSEEPESIAESNNSQPPAMKKKKKKAKRPAPPVTSDAEGDADYEEGSGGAALPPGAVRRCTHCQIEKTPQWRAGPLGPKTLCNACGVRYKSGRLFPEYRPAASPTFVPAVHSNSHKKVVEMRQKVEPKGDDLLQFIRVRRD